MCNLGGENRHLIQQEQNLLISFRVECGRGGGFVSSGELIGCGGGICDTFFCEFALVFDVSCWFWLSLEKA